MTFYTGDATKDKALEDLKNNVTKMVLTEGFPNNYADATTNNDSGTGQKICEVSVSSSDLTISDDANSGRRVTMAAKSGLTVDANGNADHVVWLDVANTTIKHVQQLASTKSLTTSGTANIPAHFYAIRDTTLYAA